MSKAYIKLVAASFLALVSLSACLRTSSDQQKIEEAAVPNILLIVADDLGFSDIAPFGSEIRTPHLDRLSEQGTRFTNFHTAIKCNPTRAMLLTGIDNNISATGTRRDWQLSSNVATISEVLKSSGYKSYIAGKWDAGSDPGELPVDRGFDRSYVLVPGAGTHFKRPAGIKDSVHREDGKLIELSESFYSTFKYGEKMRTYLDEHDHTTQPFFGFLSFSAPHYPLQAPTEAIREYSGVYDAGYQSIAKARLDRQRQMGIWPEEWEYWRGENISDWNQLSSDEAAFEARKMEIYAAMVELMDAEIGQMLEYLDENGLADNTIVIFMSDNGADASVRGAGAREAHDNSLENLGSASSYVTVGKNWAQVSSTPFRLYKTFPTQGGTRAPLIARMPGRIPAGRINNERFHVMDLMPSFMSLANASHPSKTDETILPVQGRNIIDLLEGIGPSYNDSEFIFQAYTEKRLGGAYVISGDWKLVWWKEKQVMQDAKLFNLAEDPSESKDLKAEHPDIVAKLWPAWVDYADSNKIDIASTGPRDLQP